MSQPSFTPGDWRIEPDDDGDDSVGLGPTPTTVVVETPDGNDYIAICTLHEPCCRADREPTGEYDECVGRSGSIEGNGNLIVAAPDYYRAVERLLKAEEAIAENSRGWSYPSGDEFAELNAAREGLWAAHDKAKGAGSPGTST